MLKPVFSYQDMWLFTFLAALVAGVVGGWVSLTFIQGAIAGAAWTGIVGAFVGGTITFAATTYQDRKRRNKELLELKVVLYAEIADRAARCVNDYLAPWREMIPSPPDKFTSERVAKFRPTDPFVLSGIAGKLGLLDADILLSITQFYFRLDHLTRAVDALSETLKRREQPGKLPTNDPKDQGRINLIVSRFQGCFRPALSALEKLNVDSAAAFDREATQAYRHLQQTGQSLRDALKQYAPPVI